jgi:hypothetical protein
MKKILFPTLILAIVLGMSNCKDEPEEEKKETNPFVGAWESGGSKGYLFTETEMKIYWLDFTIEDTRKKAVIDTTLGTATYVYDDKTLTVTWPEDSPIGGDGTGNAENWITDSMTQKVFVIPYDFKNGKKIDMMGVSKTTAPTFIN